MNGSWVGWVGIKNKHQLIRSNNKEWLQWAFDVLTVLFKRVGLKTNVKKTKAMTCQPANITDHVSDCAHSRGMTGQGQTCQERKRRRVVCPECNAPLAEASLKSHVQ